MKFLTNPLWSPGPVRRDKGLCACLPRLQLQGSKRRLMVDLDLQVVVEFISGYL
jgi:hypothetical protein